MIQYLMILMMNAAGQPLAVSYEYPNRQSCIQSASYVNSVSDWIIRRGSNMQMVAWCEKADRD